MADWDGAQYESVNALQQWVAQQALAGIVLDGDEQLLDIGCGDGRITAGLAARLPRGRALGIDASPGMIAAARADHPELAVELGDVLTMDFNAPFDVVTSFNVLHWVLDQRAALERIFAALRPRGWALLQFVCAGPRPSLESTAMTVCASPDWAAAFRGFRAPYVHVDPDDFGSLAGNAGFEVQSRSVEDLHWQFAGPADFAAWVSVGFGSWTRRVPGRESRFVADVVQTYSRIAGSDRTMRFMQLRVRLRRPQAGSA
ncbi:MAG TPA: class I SAM-dependent methyltransferase [Acidimicrobiales bacterium]|jgi:trans-aconitate 2-methyltransferase